jgi:hypothetical protein
MTGQQLSYNKHAIIEFGSYVQTHEQHSNNMDQRTMGAICLGPTGNQQGGHWFMSLSSGERVVRHRWTELPIPKEAIDHVFAIGRRQGMPSTITYANRHGHEIADTIADYDDDDDDSYQDDESDEDLDADSESDSELSSSSSSSSDSDEGNDDGDEPEIQIRDHNAVVAPHRTQHSGQNPTQLLATPAINQPHTLIQPPETNQPTQNQGVEDVEEDQNPGVDADANSGVDAASVEYDNNSGSDNDLLPPNEYERF